MYGMAQEVTLESVDKKIDKAVEDLSEIIQSFAQHVDDRFNLVEHDMAEMKQDIVGMKHDIADLKTNHDKTLEYARPLPQAA